MQLWNGSFQIFIYDLELKKAVTIKDRWNHNASVAKCFRENDVGGGLYRTFCTDDKMNRKERKQRNPANKAVTAVMLLIITLLPKIAIPYHFTNMPFVFRAKLIYLKVQPFSWRLVVCRAFRLFLLCLTTDAFPHINNSWPRSTPEAKERLEFPGSCSGIQLPARRVVVSLSQKDIYSCFLWWVQ